jgi:hypothetical protein
MLANASIILCSSLELNFCYPSLNLVCVYFPRKSSTLQYWRFLTIYPKCFLFLQSQYLLCVWDKSQSHPHNLQDVLATKEISLPLLVYAQNSLGRTCADHKGPFSALLSDSQPWVPCWPRDGRSSHSEATAGRQQEVVSSEKGVPVIPIATKLAPHWASNVRNAVSKRWPKKHLGVTQQGKKNSFTSAEACSHRPQSNRQNWARVFSLSEHLHLSPRLCLKSETWIDCGLTCSLWPGGSPGQVDRESIWCCISSLRLTPLLEFLRNHYAPHLICRIATWSFKIHWLRVWGVVTKFILFDLIFIAYYDLVT